MIGSPTPQPFDVYNTPLNGIDLIEASAGTGKTWNICGLYLRLLYELKLDVRQILVVTFTNAATAELRDRIRTRLVEMQRHLSDRPSSPTDPFVAELVRTLTERRKSTPEDMRLRTEVALQSFDDAAVFTIHGFCQRALADSAFAAGQAFTQELSPDDSDLLMEAAHDFWRRHIASSSLGAELSSFLLQKKDTPETFAAQIKRRLAKPLANYLWPETMPSGIDSQPLKNAYIAAKNEWQRSRDEILALLNAALGSLNKNSYKEKSIRDAAEGFDQWFIENNPLASMSKDSKLHLLRSDILTARTTGKNPTPQHLFFDLAEILTLERENAEQALALARLGLLQKLLHETPDLIRRRKQERRLLGFDDLLHNLHSTLTGGKYTWLADALRQRYPAALVDEFQDTDPQQYEIFDAIYRGHGNPLFMVGDPKQAIYRFRNADLNTYLRAKRTARTTYTISDNQRSTGELIDALNQLFLANSRAFMTPGLEYVQVGVGAKRPKPLEDHSLPLSSAALTVWQLPNASQGHVSRSDAMRHAASATAAEIARLLAAARKDIITIDGQALQASQIAVLVRSHRQGSAIRQALAALNIGSVELSQTSVWASQDAEEIERVLTAIWTPARTALLRAALATELMGLDANAIEKISSSETDLMAFTQRFIDYRSLWLQHGIGFVFRQLLAMEHVSVRMLSRPDGERRMTNLLHIGELLHQTGQVHPSPDAQLRWLQTQRHEAQSSEASQLRLESDRNLVQILTIHKSKGLEFPVVFCPFLWDGYRRRDHGLEGREYHAEDGTTVIDFHPNPENAKIISEIIREENDAEDLRLIYVALTRAIYRCYLVAGCYLSNQSTNQSKTSLLNWVAAGNGCTPEEWIDGKRKKVEAEDIEMRWQDMARCSNGRISLSQIPLDKGSPVHADVHDLDELACRNLPSHTPSGWWISSFSGLTRDATHENSASEQDLLLAELSVATHNSASTASEDDIINFPKGSRAGLCLHRAFELCDFASPASWPKAIASALAEYPQESDGKSGLLPSMMMNMLTAVTETPLPDGICLRDITIGKRLNELGFYLPRSRLIITKLNQTLKNLGYDVPQLRSHEIECYLKGFMDMVFEHQGRYYILDWKSNFLGAAADDYNHIRTSEAMAENAYHLQYLLYTVALNRYLSLRVNNYRYEDHFGGVLYLFVRGVRPEWLNADGSACGVYFKKPAKADIAQFDALFAPPTSEVA